jgi:hypothetical protein
MIQVKYKSYNAFTVNLARKIRRFHFGNEEFGKIVSLRRISGFSTRNPAAVQRLFVQKKVLTAKLKL